MEDVEEQYDRYVEKTYKVFSSYFLEPSKPEKILPWMKEKEEISAKKIDEDKRLKLIIGKEKDINEKTFSKREKKRNKKMNWKR